MQWAQFKDPDGDIHDAKNYLQGPQSEKPGKDFVDNDYWKQIFGSQGWRLVEDDYRPPAPQPTKVQQLAVLKAEYDPQIQNLQIQIAIAVAATQNATAEATLRQSLVELQTEYNDKRMVILGG